MTTYAELIELMRKKHAAHLKEDDEREMRDGTVSGPDARKPRAARSGGRLRQVWEPADFDC